MKKKILFIVNPISGVKDKSRTLKVIQDTIDNGKFDYEIIFTKYAGHGKEIARQAVADAIDVLVVAGGDGSVNEVASELSNTNVVLGILPNGSGNGLARFLQLPLDVIKSMHVINNLKVLKIDTFQLNGHFGCNIAGVGFDAHVAHKFSKVKKRGLFSYLRIILNEFPFFRPSDYEIICNNTTFRRRAILISMANSSQFGNGAVIAPMAMINDGYIEVCIISPLKWYRVPLLGWSLLHRSIHKTGLVEYIKSHEVTIKLENPIPLHIDGDPFPEVTRISLKVNPLSLNVITV